MKAYLLAFVTGAACGALGMFLAKHDPAQTSNPDPNEGNSLSIHPDRDQQKIAALEAKIAELEAGNPQLVAKANTTGNRAKSKSPRVKIVGDGEPKFDVAEMRKQMKKAEQERSGKRVAAKLASLTRELGLSDEQAEKVRALIEKQEAGRMDGLSRMLEFATTATEGGDAVPEQAGADEPDPDAFDFDTELLALLDEDQRGAYQSYVDAQNENYIEASANRQLAQLQTSVPDLSKEQKDQAFDEFARIAREETEASGEPAESRGIDVQHLIRQREAEKAAMAKILTPEQLEVYESTSMRSITIGTSPGASIITSEITIDAGGAPVEATEEE